MSNSYIYTVYLGNYDMVLAPEGFAIMNREKDKSVFSITYKHFDRASVLLFGLFILMSAIAPDSQIAIGVGLLSVLFVSFWASYTVLIRIALYNAIWISLTVISSYFPGFAKKINLVSTPS